MARIYIVVVGTPLTGRRNAISSNKIDFYFSKTYQLSMKGDQRKQQYDQEPCKWINFCTADWICIIFVFLKEGQFYVSVKKMFEDIQ